MQMVGPIGRPQPRFGSWQAAYRGLLPDEYLDRLRPEDRARSYDFATLDPGSRGRSSRPKTGRSLGFATTSPARDPDLPDHGELCALYVDPEKWGRGIGLVLVSAARAHLLEAGFRSASLWVLAGNVRAERFYRMDQWAPDGEVRTDSLWGITVNELRYQRRLRRYRGSGFAADGVMSSAV
jgi:GNAT superfamily N-acetyltransferase